MVRSLLEAWGGAPLTGEANLPHVDAQVAAQEPSVSTTAVVPTAAARGTTAGDVSLCP